MTDLNPDTTSGMFCTACKHVILTNDERIEHYRLEWHRFNVKRRCNNLLPIDRKTFELKLSALRVAQANEARITRCDPCGKEFSSDNSYRQHMNSKKHAKRVEYLSKHSSRINSPDMKTHDDTSKSYAVDSTGELMMDTDELDFSQAIPLTHCLFCLQTFDSIETSLQHMLKKHGFFVPFVEYLTDLNGLLEYLGAKIGVGHVCIYCNGRGRASYASLRAVRQHMDSKSHCKIRFEEDDDDDEFIEYYTFPSDIDDDNDKQPPQQQRMIETMNELGELVLNNGTLIGHRSMKKYYRQQLIPETKASKLLKELLQEYKMIGLPGYNKRERRTHVQIAKKLKRRHDQAYLKLGVKNNKQKYFRDSTA